MRHYPIRQSAPALWSRRLAIVAALLMAAGAGAGWLEKLPALNAMLITVLGTILGGIALVLAIAAYVDIWRSGSIGLIGANIGFVLALVLLAVPLWAAVQAFRLPVISDISTDLAEPPSFSRSRSALTARNDHVPADSAPDVREKQRRAYPDVAPVVLELGPEEAYDLVLETLKELKWRVIDQSPPSARSGLGRVDAIDSSPVFHFPDDITIRIRAQANGARVDIRSVSRHGRHDLGGNAARIVKFTDLITDMSKGQ